MDTLKYPALSAEAWNEQMEDLGYTTKKRWKRRDEPITTEEQTEWNNHSPKKTLPSPKIMNQVILSTQ